MAKGLEKHQDRQRKLSLFGKDLTRRSGACCELCSQSGVSLKVFEVPPAAQEPEYEKCLFICDDCRDALAKPKKMISDRWRVLNETIWSEVAPAQVMAARILDFLSKDHTWARDLLDEAYLDEEIEEWVKEESL